MKRKFKIISIIILIIDMINIVYSSTVEGSICSFIGAVLLVFGVYKLDKNHPIKILLISDNRKDLTRLEKILLFISHFRFFTAYVSDIISSSQFLEDESIRSEKVKCNSFAYVDPNLPRNIKIKIFDLLGHEYHMEKQECERWSK